MLCLTYFRLQTFIPECQAMLGFLTLSKHNLTSEAEDPLIFLKILSRSFEINVEHSTEK